MGLNPTAWHCRMVVIENPGKFSTTSSTAPEKTLCHARMTRSAPVRRPGHARDDPTSKNVLRKPRASHGLREGGRPPRQWLGGVLVIAPQGSAQTHRPVLVKTRLHRPLGGYRPSHEWRTPVTLGGVTQMNRACTPGFQPFKRTRPQRSATPRVDRWPESAIIAR